MRGRVIVTRHAFERVLEYWPDEFPGGAHADVCRAVVREISAAIDEGRMATRMPRFALRPGTRRRPDARVKTRRGDIDPKARRPNPGMRYVWPEDERRVYLVDRSGRGSSLHGPVAVVVTCLRGRREEAEAA
jgi:hypothetical protein